MHGAAGVGLLGYLGSGEFLLALFENWESEYLQMSAYVMLTAMLIQRGSAESGDLDDPDRADDEFPAAIRKRRQYPNLALFILALYGRGPCCLPFLRPALVDQPDGREGRGASTWGELQSAAIIFWMLSCGVGSRMKCDLREITMAYLTRGTAHDTHLLPDRHG